MSFTGKPRGLPIDRDSIPPAARYIITDYALAISSFGIGPIRGGPCARPLRVPDVTVAYGATRCDCVPAPRPRLAGVLAIGGRGFESVLSDAQGVSLERLQFLECGQYWPPAPPLDNLT